MVYSGFGVDSRERTVSTHCCISLSQFYPFGGSTEALRHCLGAPDLLEQRKNGLEKSYMCGIAWAIADEDAVEVVCYRDVLVSVASLKGYRALEHFLGIKRVLGFGRHAPTFSNGKSNGKQVTEQP